MREFDAGGFKGSVFFYRLIRAALFIAYKILFRFQHYGSEKVPAAEAGRGVILAPNHVSYLDPPLLGISLKRRVTYLAKDYLFRHFFVGWVLRSIGAYPVKSESGNDFRSIRDLIRLLKNGRCVTVFPEGTRSETGQLKDGESGIGFLAMKSGASVVPVYVDGSFEAMPRGTKKIRMHPIHVYFGDAFIPAEMEEFKNAKEPYEAVSRAIMERIANLKENRRK